MAAWRRFAQVALATFDLWNDPNEVLEVLDEVGSDIQCGISWTCNDTSKKTESQDMAMTCHDHPKYAIVVFKWSQHVGTCCSKTCRLVEDARALLQPFLQDVSRWREVCSSPTGTDRSDRSDRSGRSGRKVLLVLPGSLASSKYKAIVGWMNKTSSDR